MTTQYTRYVLDHYPDADFPANLSCFKLQKDAQANPDSLKEGQALIRIFWVSLDPLLRTWISGARSYLEPVYPGSCIPGFGVAKVVAFKSQPGVKTRFEVGDWVGGMMEWSQYMVIDIPKIQKLPMDLEHENYKYLTSYGPSGFTSYMSIKMEILPFEIYCPKLGRNKTKEEMNIVISSVGGGIGMMCTEYLSKLGYKNIYGIAGTDEKCKAAMERGCKNAINYKKYYTNGVIRAREFEADIKKMMDGEECDIYYENVGEDMLTSMLNVMANNSKVVMCGALATYNNWNEKSGIPNASVIISKRIQVKGILYEAESAAVRVQGFMEMLNLQPKGADVVLKGQVENLPQTYQDLMGGKFIGKPVVQIVHDLDS